MRKSILSGLQPLLLAAVIALVLPASPLAAQRAEKSGKDETLVYSLYVMRHGVRSPTSAPSQYDRFSSAPWPEWGVTPGWLTPHGYQLIKLLGAYDRTQLAHTGLLSNTGCSDLQHVTIHADSDQRTRETAKALAEGMFPSCQVPVQAKEEGINDPLFHLPEGSIPSEQAQRAAAAVMSTVGNNADNIATAYSVPLAALDHVLETCGVATPRTARTSLRSIPASISAGKGDHVIEARGPLNTASTLSEILLLEYTEGMPATNVGWGCVNGTQIRKLIDLHTAASELMLRNPEVAIPQSKALLRSISASLDQAANGRAVAGAEGKPNDKLTVLVGHDTNLTNIAGALQLNWLIDGRRNDTPPGSTLIFELWRRKSSGELVVRTSFIVQTLEQMREAKPLSASSPPPRVPVFLPGCSRTDGSCSLSDFHSLIAKTVEP